jgi:hypothetical protein
VQLISSGICELTQLLQIHTSLRAVAILKGINCYPLTTDRAEAGDRSQQSTILSCGEEVYCSQKYEIIIIIIIIITIIIIILI